MKKLLLYALLICLFNTGCSCNPEKLFELIAHSDFFKGTGEVMAIGGFSRAESHFSKDLSENKSKITLKLYDGTLAELYENEANIARECAKTYIQLTESENYQEIEVFIIKTDINNPGQNLYQSQYLFEVPSLLVEE